MRFTQRHIDLALVALVGLAVRVPLLLWEYDFVTYDGTYYLTQARSLLELDHYGGAFPLGYPIFSALFTLVTRDVAMAGRLVSLVAGLAATLLTYVLGRRYLSRWLAVSAALLFSLNPVFLRFSLVTMSESLYTLLVLAGLWLYGRERFTATGAVLGLATMTRPEGIAIAVVLGGLQRRHRRRLVLAMGAFVAVYSVNVIILSASSGRLVLMPKTGNLALSARAVDMGRETVDFELRGELDRLFEEQDAKEGRESVVAHYVKRLQSEIRLFVVHMAPLLPLLAIFGMVRRPTALMAALVTVLIYPFFTPRPDERHFIPYMPVIIIYGLMAIAMIRRERVRSALLAAVVLAAGALLYVHYDLWRYQPEREFEGARATAQAMSGRIGPGDVVADRKPYLAFYARANHLKIPAGPYDETLAYLIDAGATHLSMHVSLEYYSSTLVPLLNDARMIRGETRVEQMEATPTGEMVYRFVREAEPLTWHLVTGLEANNLSPTWSPDGRWIVFRGVNEDETDGYICFASVSGDSAHRWQKGPVTDAPLWWSPDGRRLLTAMRVDGNMDVYSYDLTTGQPHRVTDHPGRDDAPQWSPNPEVIVFTSDRTGRDELWFRNLDSGREQQITKGGGSLASFSPDGKRIAFVGPGGKLNFLDLSTGEIARVDQVDGIISAPSWSPDGGALAVHGSSRGTADVFLVRADGRTVLQLTKSFTPDGTPSWSPRGDEIALTSMKGGTVRIWVLRGLGAYRERLADAQFTVFEKNPLTPGGQGE